MKNTFGNALGLTIFGESHGAAGLRRALVLLRGRALLYLDSIFYIRFFLAKSRHFVWHRLRKL